ncbi:MAG: hypothetical protein ACTSX7_15255 [Alphaproteobacteria bacterium]
MTEPSMPPAGNAIGLHAILSRPYRHLARGGSVQVYGSADRIFVVKALASIDDIIAWHASDGHALTDLPWAMALGKTAAMALGKTATGKLTEPRIAELIRLATRTSFQLANQQLRQQSGLVHLHIPPADTGLPKIDCGDRTIDPASEVFVVQHMADRVDRIMNRHMAAGNTEAARQVIDDIIALVRQIWAMGIAEQTLNFHNNYGYANGRLILLDIGDLRASRDMVMDHAQQEKILHKKSAAWLQRRHPELGDYLAKRTRQCLSAKAVAILWQKAAG